MRVKGLISASQSLKRMKKMLDFSNLKVGRWYLYSVGEIVPTPFISAHEAMKSCSDERFEPRYCDEDENGICLMAHSHPALLSY